MHFLQIFAITCAILYEYQSLAYHCDVPDEWLFETNESSGSFTPGTKWLGGVVKYELDSSLTSTDKTEVQKAFDEFHLKTCVRFVERSPDDTDYVSIQTNDSICGLAQMCRVGGRQIAQFGGNCRNAATMIHELGHTLCMGHEQSRKDRDDYVNFPEDECSADIIPGKNQESDLNSQGSMYDYLSQMHSQCDSCSGGWPKKSGIVYHCGSNVTTGLSVLDADKINAFYNCGGCFGHRFHPIDSLTDAKKSTMIPFGFTIDGSPLYLCRAYTPDGAIGIGTYNGDICYLAYDGGELQFRSEAEVFTVPESADISTLKSESIYKFVSSSEVLKSRKNGILQKKQIPMGREYDGGVGYPAFATLYKDGKPSRMIGKVWAKNLSLVWFSFYGNEEVVTKFETMVC